MGITAIAGLQVLPMWLYAHYKGVLMALGVPVALQYVGIGLLSAARALCMAVEVSRFVKDHASLSYGLKSIFPNLRP